MNKRLLIIPIITFVFLFVILGFTGSKFIDLQQSAHAQKSEPIVTLLAAPNHFFVNRWGVMLNSDELTDGINTKGFTGEPIFNRGEQKNITVQYYRYLGTGKNKDDIFALEAEMPPKLVEQGGAHMEIEYPLNWRSATGYLIDRQTKLYKVVFLQGATPRAEAMFQISYPDNDCYRNIFRCE